jgi:hypothetical protein
VPYPLVADFRRSQLILKHHARRTDVLGLAINSAAVLAQFHQVADAVRWKDQVHQDERLANLLDMRRVRQLARRVDADNGAVGFLNFISDRGRGLDHGDMELALEPFLDDLHVQ